MNSNKNKPLGFETCEITVNQLKDWLEVKKTFTILDIRETWELEKAAFKRYQHICLNELQDNLEAIDTTHPVVVVCHHGKRSLAACYYLRSCGLDNVVSLKGGIHLWAEQVDPSIGTY